ncbi:MAG: UvrD-helicase domain-containing protein [Lachnospiraceae bacterium]|nr:UvrD-helicase domain-containing protein [Lachnospiraceae bacterium]
MGFFEKLLSPRLESELEQSITKNINAFNLAVSKFPETYISKTRTDEFVRRWGVVYKEIKGIRIRKKHELYPDVQKFLSDYEQIRETVASSNSTFLDEEKKRHDALLSSIDGKSLDDQQRTVVVTDEDRNLVIAGAGSGKTLTIAGKVKYLCDAKGIAPKDILLIAFTRKSAEEMTERISIKLGLSVQATTFHKLGLDIITEASGKRPDVQDDLTDFVRDYFEERIIGNPKAVKNLIKYFAYYLKIPADMEKYDSLGAAYEAEKDADFETIRGKYDRAKFASETANARRADRRTLRDEQVKSLDEVSIANFLFLNGVKYEYEHLYPFESDDLTRKAYRPDFYLPDYDIYIEHFGIDRAGRLPWLSAIEEQKYQEDMKWKREFHRQHGTTLLETYSYYSSDGRLNEVLEKKLKEQGVEFKEPDFIDIFNAVYASGSDKYFPEFIGLCCTFITLFKSGGHDPGGICALHSANTARQKPFYLKRTALFLEIIAPLLQAYNATLEEQGAIDFSDMINKAAGIVADGLWVRPYKWVIVDEYQDISVARYKLVKAILDQTGAKLLCVGDDWQSIYRFTGSDITLFTHFDRYFDAPAIMRLEQTYRNSQQLIDVVGDFIMKNPQQYKKSLRSAKSLDYPITFMCYKDNPFSMLQRTVNKIIRGFGADASILLLGRTNNDQEMLRESNLFQVKKSGELTYNASPATPISFLTVHRSKGLEADNVVLLNFRNETLGFPNKIADDPLLGLVLTDGDEFPYAEERRLLYVALTRTRNRVFVLVDESRPSEFMREFRPSKSVFILNREDRKEVPSVACPRCKTGRLTVRKNESSNRYFVGCSNYPRCDYTVRDTAVMNDTRYCPQCGGLLVKRKGKWGAFYGCTNYPACSYTEKLGYADTGDIK